MIKQKKSDLKNIADELETAQKDPKFFEAIEDFIRKTTSS